MNFELYSARRGGGKTVEMIARIMDCYESGVKAYFVGSRAEYDRIRKKLPPQVVLGYYQEGDILDNCTALFIDNIEMYIPSELHKAQTLFATVSEENTNSELRRSIKNYIDKLKKDVEEIMDNNGGDFNYERDYDDQLDVAYDEGKYDVLMSVVEYLKNVVK